MRTCLGACWIHLQADTPAAAHMHAVNLPRSAPALAAQAARHPRRHVKHGLVAAVCRTSGCQALAGALARRRGHLRGQLAGSSCRQARRDGRRRRSLPLGREQQVGERGFTAPLHGWMGGRAAGLVEGAVREGAARHKRTKPCIQQQAWQCAGIGRDSPPPGQVHWHCSVGWRHGWAPAPWACTRHPLPCWA